MPVILGPGAFMVPGDVESSEDVGLLSQNFSPSLTDGNGQLLSVSMIYATRLWIPRSCRVTNIKVYVTTGGVTLTAATAFAAIYHGNSGGTLGAQIGVTADQSTNWTSVGEKTMALTSGPFSIVGGKGYWVYGVVSVGAGTTMPALGKVTQGNSGFMQAGLASEFRCATCGTTTTTLPTTLGARTASNVNLWMALT